ncbi:hypothetical protein GS432_20595 [Rhodococcus hoagii]|nr:hypothetical protein [Prescottella equi]
MTGTRALDLGMLLTRRRHVDFALVCTCVVVDSVDPDDQFAGRPRLPGSALSRQVPP